MNHLPRTTKGYYVPPMGMLHSDWINTALCASRRASENVFSKERWESEYYCYMGILRGKVTR